MVMLGLQNHQRGTLCQLEAPLIWKDDAAYVRDHRKCEKFALMASQGTCDDDN